MSKYAIRVKSLLTPSLSSARTIWVSDGVITALEEPPPGESDKDYQPLDLSDLTATPGLFDLQVNGSPACNFWDGPTASQLDELRSEMTGHGVTSFLPTLITAPLDYLTETRDFLAAQGAGEELKETLEPTGLSRMPGIHLEGPCLSPKRPGVHPPAAIRALDLATVETLYSPAIKLVTAALELDDGKAQEYLQERGVVVSLGHSNASLEEASRAFDAGARLLTHAFNALPPLHHRQPGAVGAALLDRRVSCCMIADGLHLAPQICDLIYRLKGVDHTILVTDRATVGTDKGGLVGASIILDQAVRNMVSWGICSLSDAVRMASTNPARALGLDRLGTIAPGMLADIAFFDDDLVVRQTMLAGALY